MQQLKQTVKQQLITEKFIKIKIKCIFKNINQCILLPKIRSRMLHPRAQTRGGGGGVTSRDVLECTILRRRIV